MAVETSSRFLYFLVLSVFVYLFSACSTSITDPPDPFDPTENLVAYYSFNTNYMDASGNGLNASAHNTSFATDRKGNPASAVFFQGKADSYLLVPHTDILNISNEMTITFWINLHSLNNYSFVFAKGQDIQNSYSFLVDKNIFQYLLTQEKGIYQGVANETGIEINTWHFISCVLNPEVNRMLLYLDGEVIAEKNHFAFLATNTYPLVFGRHFTIKDGSGGYEYPFSGKLDEFRIYDKALTYSNILELYNDY